MPLISPLERYFIIPSKNERDIDEIPEEVKDKIDIKLVNSYEEIYNEIFIKKKKN